MARAKARRAAGWLALAPLLLAPGCGGLSTIEPGVCGNEVHEPTTNGEDCDTYPLGSCGAPGTPQECRFICDPTVGKQPHGCDASQGFGCGVDGICRQHRGTFERAQVLSLGLPALPAVDDFDGDGRDDLVASTLVELGVYFGIGAGSSFVGAPYYLPVHYGNPTTGDLTQDNLPDLVMGDDWGLDVLRARADRTVWPRVYPLRAFPSEWEGQAVRLIFADVIADSPSSDGGLGETMSHAGRELLVAAGDTLYYYDPRLDEVWALQKLPGDVETLAGAVQVGQVREDPTAPPCEQVVLAFYNQPAVWLQMTCPLGERHEAAPHVYAYPSGPIAVDGGVVHGGVVLADVNLDGHLDLMIRAVEGANKNDAGAPNRLWLAYGRGDGAFIAPDDGAISVARPIDLGATKRAPLAAADLNDDGQVDLVLPDGIYLSHPQLPAGQFPDIPYYRATYGEHDWDRAHIADFNGDGRPDVVAADSDWPELYFFGGTDSWTLRERTIALAGVPRHLSLGDVDGDGLLDLAFAEIDTFAGDTAEAASTARLAVAFGSASFGLEPATRVAELPSLSHLAVGSWARYYYDDIADIVATSRDADGDNLVALGGSPDRRLWASYPVQAEETEPGDVDGDDLPFVSVVGRFGAVPGETEAHQDIAALTREIPAENVFGPEANESFVWLLRSAGEAQLQRSWSSYVSYPLEHEAHVLGYSVPLMAAVDLDADQRDELVVLSMRATGASDPLFTGAVVVGRATTQGDSWVWQFDAPREQAELFCQNRYWPSGCYPWAMWAEDMGSVNPTDPPPGYAAYDGNVEVVNVDGDENGRPDVVALGYAAAEAELALAPNRLVVWLNQGTGQLEPAHRHVFGPPAVEVPGLPPTMFAVSLLNADSDAQLEAAICTGYGALLADLDFANDTLVALGWLNPSDPFKDPAQPCYKTARGDFNGDGVDDVALVGRTEVLLMRGMPLRQ